MCCSAGCALGMGFLGVFTHTHPIVSCMFLLSRSVENSVALVSYAGKLGVPVEQYKSGFSGVVQHLALSVLLGGPFA